jgi:hypothetical protein
LKSIFLYLTTKEIAKKKRIKREETQYFSRKPISNQRLIQNKKRNYSCSAF